MAVDDAQKKERILAGFQKTLEGYKAAPPPAKPHFHGAALGLLGALKLSELISAEEYDELAAQVGESPVKPANFA